MVFLVLFQLSMLCNKPSDEKNNSHLLFIFLTFLEVSNAQLGSSCWVFAHFQPVVAGPNSSQRFVCSTDWHLDSKSSKWDRWDTEDTSMSVQSLQHGRNFRRARVFNMVSPDSQMYVSYDGKSHRRGMYYLLFSNLRIHVARPNASPYSTERSLDYLLRGEISKHL